MKRSFVTLFLFGVMALAGSAFAEQPKNVDALVAKLPEAQTKGLRASAVVTEARANEAFYVQLKKNDWSFDDVALTRAQVVALAFSRQDLGVFDSREAAKFLPLTGYKSYVAAKLQAIGKDAIAAFDWLQQQRLVVVEVDPRDAALKGEFLGVIAEQVIAQDKAKAGQ